MAKKPKEIAVTNKPKDELILEAVKTARGLVWQHISNTIQLYWSLGKLVAELDSGYGKSAVQEFATKLSESLGREQEFDESTLYRARQFFTKFGVDLRNRFQGSGVSWTQVTQVLPEDTTLVIAAMNQLEEGKIKSSQLAATVRAMRAGDGDPEANKQLQANDPESTDRAILDSTDLTSDTAENNPTDSVGSGQSAKSSEMDDSGTQGDNTPDRREDHKPESPEDRLGDPATFDREVRKAEASITGVIDVMGTLFILLDKFNKFDKDIQKKYKKDLVALRESLSNLSQSAGPIYKALQAL